MPAEHDENRHGENRHGENGLGGGRPERTGGEEGRAGRTGPGESRGDGARLDGGVPHGDGNALMAAVTGEQPPQAVLADGSFAEAYRSAAADVAVLREQLGLIGAALAEPPPAQVPRAATVAPPAPRRRRRPAPRALALRGLVAAAAAAVVLGMGWLVVHSDGTGAQDDQGASSAADGAAGRSKSGTDFKTDHAGYLACARLVAEGTVVKAEVVPGTAQDRVTLDVTRYYEPAKGSGRITFPLAPGTSPVPRAGDHLLVGIPRGQDEPDLWAAGEREIARERAWITAALPDARTLPCP
ncbi:hypothetical protein [Streptomyces djakartensis]|uniref:hypothetical protein n=1 Tax=Streptomyces djakartensis TaxID=68193 RepID=UPI0034DE2CC1